MGCAFNYVVVPSKVQKVADLRKFYEEYKENLLEQYGEEFEGYTGDMAVDDGTLVVKKDLKIEAEGEISQEDAEEYFEELLELCSGHCEKWGPSIAVRLGNQWVICGAYSD